MIPVDLKDLLFIEVPSLLFFSAAKIEPSKVAPAMAAAPEAGPVKVRGLETRKFPIWIPYSLLVKKVNIECYERLTDSKQFMEIVMQTIKNGFTILKFLCFFFCLVCPFTEFNPL